MQTSHILIGLATLAIILIFWTVKRYLIKRKAAKDRAVKPIPKKSESAPAAAANQRDVEPVRAESSFQTSESVQPFVEKRQPGVVDRRHHAVEAQKAEPAPAVVREETPAAVTEAVKIAEAPKAEPAPAAVREEIPAAVTETARTAEAPKAEPAPAAARGELPADWLPEDSVLRRHYLTHLQSEREALTNPYPTDSTLRRHYDAMVKIQIDGPSIQAHEENVPTQEESRLEDLESGQSAVASLQDEIASERESSSVATYDEIQAEAAAEDWLPEDSVLRRHYLTHLQSEREALTNPYPTDSTLRRHYETMIKMELGWQPAGTGSEEAPAPQENAVKAPASGQPEAKAQPSLAVVREVVRVPAAEHKMRIPEDSVLRRHFLSHLQYEVESELPDRPTDSVLKRHHDALVCARMAERLQQLQA
jgi:cyanate lyase